MINDSASRSSRNFHYIRRKQCHWKQCAIWNSGDWTSCKSLRCWKRNLYNVNDVRLEEQSATTSQALYLISNLLHIKVYSGEWYLKIVQNEWEWWKYPYWWEIPFQSLVPIAEDLNRPREFEKSTHPDESEEALEDNLIGGNLPPFEDSDISVWYKCLEQMARSQLITLGVVYSTCYWLLPFSSTKDWKFMKSLRVLNQASNT